MFKTIQQFLVCLVTGILTVPAEAIRPEYTNVQTAPLTIPVVLAHLKKIDYNVQEFKDLYAASLTFDRPKTNELDLQMQAAETITNSVLGKLNTALAATVCSSLLVLASTSFAVFSFAHWEKDVYKPNMADLIINMQLKWKPRILTGTVSAVVAAVTGALAIYSFMKLKKYNQIYAPAKNQYDVAKNQKQKLYDKAKSDAEEKRSSTLVGFLNILMNQANVLNKGLDNTFLQKNAKLLKQKTVDLKEQYLDLDPVFKLTKPGNAVLQELLIPQYKTIVVETTTEVEKDKVKDRHVHQATSGHDEQSNQTYHYQQTSLNPQPDINSYGSPPVYTTPHAPPPYNPEWVAEGYRGYPDLTPSAPPAYPDASTQNNNLASVKSSRNDHNRSSVHNENNRNREKNRVSKVEKRVLDDERNSRSKQKVKAFKDFYKTLEIVESLCDTLKDMVLLPK